MAYLDRTDVGTGLGPGPIKFYCSRSSPHISCSMKIQHNTRMHSNRMRTARLLTVSQHALLGRGVPAWGCTCLGVYLPGAVYLSRGCTCPGGVYLPRYSPPVNRMTDRCKNITLPQTSFAGGNNASQFSPVQVPVPFKLRLNKPLLCQPKVRTHLIPCIKVNANAICEQGLRIKPTSLTAC